MSAKQTITLTVEVRIDPEAYALNYGDGYPQSEAVEYARDIVSDALHRRMDEVGGWAQILTVEVDAAADALEAQ